MTERFVRERVRYDLRMRRITVSSTQLVTENLLRVTFQSPELEGFDSRGPADHIKMFFPDPKTDTLTLPEITAEGIKRPTEGQILSRDYTPLSYRTAGVDVPELDIDFVLHGDSGPASYWAARAAVGDELFIAGPRGSHLAPTALESALLVADESALPSVRRWIETLDPALPVIGLFSVLDANSERYLADLVAEHRDFRWFSGDNREQELEAALRAHAINEGTFINLAGESGMLVPLRRYLRRELNLPKDQVSAEGYWKRGSNDFDHHAPLDPSDPDDD